jgi:hypothetical protein
MEDIDQTIDLMNKQQLVTCVAKSSAKRRRLNVQYTTQNQRVSIERIEKIYETFERLLRDIIKIWIRDEKTVRLKYLKPITEERKTYLIRDLNDELETILKQIAECRLNYKKMGALELFEKKFQETEISVKADVENKIGELFEQINAELASSKKIEPAELVQLYRIEEQTLIELRLIKPLQEINVSFYEMPDDFKPVADGIQNTITLCGKYYEKGALKNIVLTLETLMSYAMLAEENRNQEVLGKNKERLIQLLKLAPEAEERLQAIQPLMDWF